MMRPGLRLLLGLLLLAGLIVLVELEIGWRELLRPWRDRPVAPLLLALALVFMSYTLRALRLRAYFPTEMSGRLGCGLRLMLQHNLYNNLLPMRAGELSFPLLMRRYFTIPLERSLPALLWFRVLDLHTLAVFVLVCLPLPWGAGVSWLIAALVLPLPWLLYHSARRLRNLVGRDDAHGWRKGLARLLAGLPQHPGMLASSWLWTIANWTVKLAVFAWILQGFVTLPFDGALLGAISGDLTSVLPINGIAGAGSYEAGVVAGLMPYGVPTREALAGAVNLHLFVLASTLLGGLSSLFIGRGGRS